MNRFEARQWFLNGTLIGFRVERGHGPRLEICKAFPFADYPPTLAGQTLAEVLAKDLAAAANKLMEI